MWYVPNTFNFNWNQSQKTLTCWATLEFCYIKEQFRTLFESSVLLLLALFEAHHVKEIDFLTKEKIVIEIYILISYQMSGHYV